MSKKESKTESSLFKHLALKTYIQVAEKELDKSVRLKSEGFWVTFQKTEYSKSHIKFCRWVIEDGLIHLKLLGYKKYYPIEQIKLNELSYLKIFTLLSDLVNQAEKEGTNQLERLLNKLALAKELVRTTMTTRKDTVFTSKIFGLKRGVHTTAHWRLRNKRISVILSPGTKFEIEMEVNKKFFELTDEFDYEGAFNALDGVVKITSIMLKHTVKYFDDIYEQIIKL